MAPSPGRRSCARTPAALLMNLWVYPGLALWTLLGLAGAPLLFVIIKLCTGWSTARIARLFIWLYGRGWMVLVRPFVRFETEGFDADYRGRAPCVFVINHLSFFDTYCMAAQPLSNIAFAVRGWPFRRLVWYTALMKMARYLDTENDNFTANLEQAREIIAAGGSILFFPEGHRSRDGRLQRFYSGAFLTARELKVPLVPLCISGTDTLLPPGSFRLCPARVRLKALPPFDPADYPETTGHIRMRKEVKEAMATELERMRQP